MHFKSNILFSGDKSLNVDKDNGIIKNVCIVQFGANKNGSFFSEKYLQDLANGANEINQGVKSRYGHPNMCSTTLGKFIGRYKNFSFGKDVNDKSTVFAELHLDPITKKTQVEGQGISMFDYITDMAETNSDMFGNSIHIPTPKFEKELVEIEGKKYQSHIFNGIVASDLVDSPAATDALFSNVDDLGVLVTQFLDENPSIFEAITKKPEIIINFFETYENYLNNYKSNTNMKFLEKLKKTFSNNETFDIEETTADGEIVKVTTEDENPKVGDSVTKEDGSSIDDGDLTVKDGTIWVIEGGKISEIKPKEEDTSDDDDVEPTNTEVMQSVNALAETFKTFQTKYAEDNKENQDAIELVATTFEKKFNNLAKTVKSSSPDYQKNADDGKKKKFSNSNYDADKVREEREKRKNK